MRATAALLLVPLLFRPADAGAAGRAVSTSEILAAMRASEGYTPTATTNGPRFNAEVLLHLLRASAERDAADLHLFVGYAEWYKAYLERTALTAEKAPLYARLSYDHHQDIEVDARPGRVIERVMAGPQPRLAANVKIGWPAAKGGKDRYSYDDTLAVPRLRVTNERVIVYRLLDYGDVIVYDEIEGLRGRPTEGFLGVLFDLIGEGSVRWSRMALSKDGLQVSRARATKGPFGVESTVTVFPDGRVQKDLLPERPDLADLERRLLEARKLRYVPIDHQRAPAESVTEGAAAVQSPR